MNEDIEIGVLRSIGFVGWANLILFFFCFIGIKGATDSSFKLLIGSLLLCLFGTLFYYLAYSRVFKLTPKKEAITFFKPYRLGVISFVFGILTLMLLPFIKGV